MTTVKYIESVLSSQLLSLVKEHMHKFEEILASMDIKTKNKRIRKKATKSAALQLMNSLNNATINKVVKEDSNQLKKQSHRNEVNDVTETFDFQRLPVGFMLKVGKQFFEKEQVFRFYYNQNHEEFYKNKTLLISQFKKLVEDADANLKNQIRPLIQSQLSS